MEQRRLRLGDILDDYCPRERRVTNHAVVAMIEEKVKQTRCTTCDAEHSYKGARVPKRRKKDAPASLYEDVLAGMPDVDPRAPEPVPHASTTLLTMPGDATADGVALPQADPDSTEEPHPPMQSDDKGHDTSPSLATTSAGSPAPSQADMPRGHAAADDGQRQDESDDERDGEAAEGSDGPVHRRLIRATLPRPEGQKDSRPLPEFTVRHSPARGNGGGPFRGGERVRARGGQPGGHGEPNGNRPPASHGRFQGGRPSGAGRPPGGRGGGAAGFRGGHAGPKSRRGRGSR